MNDCIFCKIAKKEIPGKFIYEDEMIMVIMDINPACDGHALVIPKKHFETIFDVEKDVLAHIQDKSLEITEKIMKATGEKGVTFLINYGDKQEVKHMHMHIMPSHGKEPERSIDENFSLIIGDN